MDIVIVHLKRSGLKVSPLFRVDRATALGNPASHLEKSQAEVRTKTVDEAVDYFDNGFKDTYNSNSNVKELMEQIYQAALTHPTIYLGCWCMDELDPKPYDHNCHCTVIRRVTLNRYRRESKCN